MNKSEDYADIPGTYLFDRKACAKGYALNHFCMSLMKPKNRRDFLANEDAYLSQYALSDRQRRAVVDRNWLGMIQEGGNICYVAKLGATCGYSMEDLAASMSGMTKANYRRMMLSGGRPIEGNRSKDERLRMSGAHERSECEPDRAKRSSNVSPIGRNDQVMQARQGAAISKVEQQALVAIENA
jgi:protocatechuate 4,5-dioxygenase alpha chain